MPFETIIRLLSEAKNLGVFVIKIAGGEPLLHPKILNILDWCYEQDIKVALLTNLTAKEDLLLSVFERVKQSQVINLQASLDSIDPLTNNATRGKTSRVLKNIELAIEHGIDLQIATVLTAKNVESAHGIVSHYFPRLRRFHFMNLMPTLKIRQEGTFDSLRATPEQAAQFWRRVRTFQAQHPEQILVTQTTERGECNQLCQYSGCSAGYTFCEVDSNADVIACNIASSFVLGNVAESSLAEVWRSDFARKIG